ncbi:MAG: hypothetical protein LBF38_03015 [Deltaproteobacteria bacterium]|jgi:hypothetical protein|nr:hypothetical protein [Deltaproteobacteria bacterium]
MINTEVFADLQPLIDQLKTDNLSIDKPFLSSENLDKDMITMINSSSVEQLYEYFAELQIALMNSQYPSIRKTIKQYRTKIKTCIIKSVRNTYNLKEMRELFIQPPGMDYTYYTLKNSQLGSKMESCVISILR